MYIHTLIGKLAKTLSFFEDKEDALPPAFVRIFTENGNDGSYVDLPVNEVILNDRRTAPILVVDQTKLPKFETDATARERKAHLREQYSRLSCLADDARELAAEVDGFRNGVRALLNNFENEGK